MSFKQITPMSAVTNNMQNGIERLYRTIIRSLYAIGEQCINDARINGSYTDQSGCLRSSIGYVIVQDGKIVNLVCNGDSAEGRKQGRAFLKDLAANESKGIVLIVTAGMEYARYVSAKGYNVLDSSEILADKLVRALVKKLSKKR